MDETLYKLLAWLSPAYPVGGFTYSHGLETAVDARDVRDRDSLTDWIADILVHGAGRIDGVLLACAWRAERDGDAAGLAEVAELAVALAPSSERRLETVHARRGVRGDDFGRLGPGRWPGGVSGRVRSDRRAAWHPAPGRARRATCRPWRPAWCRPDSGSGSSDRPTDSGPSRH